MNSDLKASTNNHIALRAIRILVLAAGMLLIGYGLPSCSTPPDAPVKTEQPYEPLPANSDGSVTDPLDGSIEWGEFTHSNPDHAQLSCLICHRRDDNSARVNFPGKQGHTPCIACHTQQFDKKNGQICTICHENPGEGSLKRFPRLRGFNARFDHAKHLRIANCATCHKPIRRGVALSIPAGANAHATCFQCHSSNAPHNMSNCNLCHQPGRAPRKVSESAKAFRLNFSHAQHISTNCTACHRILRGASRGRQVTAPVAAMHFPPKKRQSCATCHNNKKVFGGDDFNDCKRCHKGNTFTF